ncbi:MAG: hypothetical protein LBP65_02885 [Puniceicoccales bacterium]|jgi:ankyrin repeat protein|nr:hypothetical protein [Puniceicoccales bacterium]
MDTNLANPATEFTPSIDKMQNLDSAREAGLQQQLKNLVNNFQLAGGHETGHEHDLDFIENQSGPVADLLQRTTSGGWTAVMQVLRYGSDEVRLEMVNLLGNLEPVTLVLILQQASGAGRTAPMFALRNGNEEVQLAVLKLLETLEPIVLVQILQQSENTGWNAMMHALHYGSNAVRLEMLRLLGNFEQAALAQVLRNGGKAVTSALEYGNLETQLGMLDLLGRLDSTDIEHILQQHGEAVVDFILSHYNGMDAAVRVKVIDFVLCYGSAEAKLKMLNFLNSTKNRDLLQQIINNNHTVVACMQCDNVAVQIQIIRAVMSHGGDDAKLTVLNFLKQLEPERLEAMLCLTDGQDGWTVAMIMAQYGGKTGPKTFALLLEKLTPAARARVLEKATNHSGSTVTMFVFFHCDDGDRLKVLNLMNQLDPSAIAHLLQQKDSKGLDVLDHILQDHSNMSTDVLMKVVNLALRCGNERAQLKVLNFLESGRNANLLNQVISSKCIDVTCIQHNANVAIQAAMIQFVMIYGSDDDKETILEFLKRLSPESLASMLCQVHFKSVHTVITAVLAHANDEVKLGMFELLEKLESTILVQVLWETAAAFGCTAAMCVFFKCNCEVQLKLLILLERCSQTNAAHQLQQIGSKDWRMQFAQVEMLKIAKMLAPDKLEKALPQVVDIVLSIICNAGMKKDDATIRTIGEVVKKLPPEVRKKITDQVAEEMMCNRATVDAIREAVSMFIEVANS